MGLDMKEWMYKMDEYISREETKKALGLNFGSVMDAVYANRIVDSVPIAFKWIPASEQTPKAEEEVRLFCKSKYGTYQCQGFYIPKKMNEEDSKFCWDYELLDYDEENDISYVQSGWYERIYNWDDYSTVGINDEVLYWMPLPENPEGWNE